MSDYDALEAAEAKLRDAMRLIRDWNDQSTWDRYGTHGSRERAVAMNRGYLHAYTAKLHALQDLQAAGGGGRDLGQIQEEINRVKIEIAGDRARLEKWGEPPY